MPGLGTLVNTAAVILGGSLGLFVGGRLKQRYQDILMQALGLCTMFIGLSGAMSRMLTVSQEGLTAQGSMMLIGSLVFGALAGEFLDIERRLDGLGEFLKRKVNAKEDSPFVEGFVTSALVICVGAMAIVGSLQDGLSQDPSTLFAKAVLDFVIVMVFASTLGVGVIFSALPLFVYQGVITLMASVISPLLTDRVIGNLSFVGSVLIFAVGINLFFGKRVKVGNLLPAMIVPFFFP